MTETTELKIGQQVRALSNRWTPTGWEPIEQIATVLDPCVKSDPDYAGDVEIKIEGELGRTFVPRASVEPIDDPAAPSIPEGEKDIIRRQDALDACSQARAYAEKHYGIAEGVGADMARRRITLLPGANPSIDGAAIALRGLDPERLRAVAAECSELIRSHGTRLGLDDLAARTIASAVKVRIQAIGNGA